MQPLITILGFFWAAYPSCLTPFVSVCCLPVSYACFCPSCRLCPPSFASCPISLLRLRYQTCTGSSDACRFILTDPERHFLIQRILKHNTLHETAIFSSADLTPYLHQDLLTILLVPPAHTMPPTPTTWPCIPLISLRIMMGDTDVEGVVSRVLGSCSGVNRFLGMK